MPNNNTLLRVAVPTPLRKSFDYLPPKGCALERLVPGVRVLVPFGRRQLVGVLLDVVNETDIATNKLKRTKKVLDESPVIPSDLLKQLQWASHYYHHPIGEVISAALPTLLRQDRPATAKGEHSWTMTTAGQQLDSEKLKRAPRQRAILEKMQQLQKANATLLDGQFDNWRPIMAKLVEKGWLKVEEETVLPPVATTQTTAPALNEAQQQAVTAIQQGLNDFTPFLLDGVTGSGKTEVYLAAIEKVVANGKQVLVLVPEIGLTPQLVARFRERLTVPVVVLHSALSSQQRLSAWLAARAGQVQVIIGTRSAVFTPLAQPGLFIVDEEHDLSFKQQDGFRYSARDLAILRARDARVPVVLGSATPSLESIFNQQRGRYQLLHLPQRAGVALAPTLRVLDVRKQPMDHLISVSLRQAIRHHLAQNGQVLLFLNRRGYAPMLICHDCGWVSQCPRCDSRMTLHQHILRLRCHHCGTERPIPESCPTCESAELRRFGYGTERIEESLRKQFPGHKVLRIDADTTRRKGAFDDILDAIHAGEGEVLIGTQMLAKGHHFPNVTLVGILDADYGLYSADFRASEHMAQLIIQVAGRAGRAERPGEVLIQTHHPEHPLLQLLVQQDYAACADMLLQERQEVHFPPYSHLAMLRAESVSQSAPMDFLAQAAEVIRPRLTKQTTLLGPIPSPMERRAGRYRAQLLLQAGGRQALQQLLSSCLPALESLKPGRQVRWSLDVDPMQLF